MSNPVLSSLAETRRPAAAAGPVTLDDVVMSTATLLTITIAVGTAAAVLVPVGLQMSVLVLAAFTALGLSLLLSFTRLRFNPAAVMTFAAVEGVVLGPLTRHYADYYDGVVTGAVAGTVCGFAGILAAYKMFDIKLTSKTRRFVVAAMFGFVAVGIVDAILMSFGTGVGFAGFGPLGLLFSAGGVVLACFSLLMDFDDVETAVAHAAPAPYKWALGFGLLVSLVWMYTNLLRLLAILNSD